MEEKNDHVKIELSTVVEVKYISQKYFSEILLYLPSGRAARIFYENSF